MQYLLISLNAICPILLYLLFGYSVRAIGWFSEENMKSLNRLAFRAFFPILMFYNMYEMEHGTVIRLRFVLFIFATIGAVMIFLFLTIPRLEKDNRKRSVIIQAIYRSNVSLYALPMTQSVYGKPGVTVATTMIAFVVPIYNMLAVFVLEYYRGGKLSAKNLVKAIVSNPLIVGIVTGLLFHSTGWIIPKMIETPMAQFANMCSPLALFALGGTMHFSDIKNNRNYLISAMGFKLLVLPAIMLALASLAGFESVERFVLFSMAATPVATASYTMALSMDADATLAGEFVVFSSAVSVVTMFLWISLLGALQML